MVNKKETTGAIMKEDDTMKKNGQFWKKKQIKNTFMKTKY